MSLLKTPDSNASTWPPTYVSESRTWPSLVSLLKTYKNVWCILLVQTGRTTIYIGKGRVSLVWSMPEYCYSPLDRRLVHRRVTPSSMLPVPIYTAGWRETMWSKVPSGFVPFFEQKLQGLYKDFQGHISHFSRTPFSAKKRFESMSFLVLPQHEQFYPEGLSY